MYLPLISYLLRHMQTLHYTSALCRLHHIVSLSLPFSPTLPPSLPPSATFTVMSYNVLCDKYATRQQYGYCPSWALVWEYRKSAILKEILDSTADIIALQVSNSSFILLYQTLLSFHFLPFSFLHLTSLPSCCLPSLPVPPPLALFVSLSLPSSLLVHIHVYSTIFSSSCHAPSLQEVETDQYYAFFLPELSQHGYDGFFNPKSRARTMGEHDRKFVDGCAIFYHKSK